VSKENLVSVIEQRGACESPETEAETIRLAQQGDPAAFEQLYRLHSRRVFAVCVRMLENRAAAEDLTQETFLAGFRKIHLFRGESAFSTWLHRVTVNLVLMHIRKQTLAQSSLEDINEKGEETGSVRYELGGPDLHLSGFLDRVRLQKAIDQLPLGFKVSFVLYDIQGYRHKEIADILGCSAGTSKSQLHKARLRLRELLQEHRRGRTPGNGSSSDRSVDQANLAGGRTVPPVKRPKLLSVSKRDRDSARGVLTCARAQAQERLEQDLTSDQLTWKQ
jgi:RNA polymerase sigma-70 factor, ECF subfamily